MEKRKTLLIDMYGVIIEESKGNFIPYTLKHFDETRHGEILHMLREKHMFQKVQIGEVTSEEFMTSLGYQEPVESMKDYLKKHLTLDPQFKAFAEHVSRVMDIVLISNDVSEWSAFLTEYHGLNLFFTDKIISGEVHMRKPEKRIFSYALEKMKRAGKDCVFVDNSSKNLLAAKSMGISTVLFNRDFELYDGITVNNFIELEQVLKHFFVRGKEEY